MKLIGSHTSPFVRTIRILLEELNLDYAFDVMPPFAKMTDQDIAHISQNNPLMKIPILIDEDHTIFETRIIARYIEAKAGRAPLHWEDENFLSVILGTMEAGILKFILSLEDIDSSSPYLQKSHQRIQSGLSFIDDKYAHQNDPHICDMALVSMLEWFEKRQIMQWAEYDNINTGYRHLKDRPAFAKTLIPDDL